MSRGAPASRRTKILALLLPTDETPVDPYTGGIIVGAAEAARESGDHLLLWTEPASRAPELNELVRVQFIDAAIVLAIQLDDPRIALLEAVGLPLVTIGRIADGHDLTYVDADGDALACRAIGHLVERGRRSIAFVAGSAADPDAGCGIAVRLHAALRRWATSFDVELVSVFDGRTAADGAASVTRLLAERPELDGVLASGDVDFMLRLNGEDVYDQWVNHEIPFNDPQIETIGQAVRTRPHNPSKLRNVGVSCSARSGRGTLPSMGSGSTMVTTMGRRTPSFRSIAGRRTPGRHRAVIEE